jgi:pimeloyl-ACP methyl ester carboxylesterase
MALIVLAVIVALFILRFSLPAGTPRIRVPEGRDPAKVVAVLERVRLGGADQWILERSENTDNPILLFLHGGPGTSQLTMNRRNTRALEQSFVVVNWDQRGAGKSYRAIGDVPRMHVAQFVEDTHDLTVYLLEKFHQDRIVLVGHSWGSLIGVLTAARYPELFHCYVGIGQAANMMASEIASYQWTLQQAELRHDTRAIAALQRMGPPPYPGDWRAHVMTERRLLARYGGERHANSNGAFGLVMGGVAFSREYGLADRVNVFRGILGSMKLLWPEMLQVDLFTSVPELQIPVYLMEGRFDHEAASEIAERYFHALKAPSKELTWFEHSAHMLNFEEREKFDRILVERIRPSIVRRGVPAAV